MIDSHGPSIVFLPAARLERRNIEKASGLVGVLAKGLEVSGQQVRDQARGLVMAELEVMGQLERYRGLLS